MKIAFIDASVTELKKNYLGIAEYCKRQDGSINSIFISVDTASNVVEEMERQSLDAIVSSGYDVLHLDSFNRRKITEWVKKEEPDLVFSNAMNTYNMLWNCICNKNGIPSFFYPHGFQIDNLYYKKSALFSKVRKIMRYAYAIWNVSKEIDRPFVPMFKDYSGYISKGNALVGTSIDHQLLYPSKVFVYSDYYKEFWHRKYGIHGVSYETIMPYDFLLVKPVLQKPQEEAVCYITQTLYEDGRYSRSEYYELLLTYRELAKKVKKLYVKLHPRVDSTEYEKAFNGLDNVQIVRDFPNCKCYITHYSSMAYTAKLVSGNVVIHELPNQPTHEVYKEVASVIAYDIDEVITGVETLMKKEDDSFELRKKSIEKYATFSELSPYEVIYNALPKLK